MMSDRQRAARMRSSQIRTLKGIRVNLIEDPKDREEMQNIIDRQLRSMGAETHREWKARIDKMYAAGDKINFDEYNKTGKPYKMTEDDIKRYNRW